MALYFVGANFLNQKTQKTCLSKKSQVYERKVHLRELSNWPIPKPSQTWFPLSVANHPSLFFWPYIWVIYFLNSIICSCFCFLSKEWMDLLIICWFLHLSIYFLCNLCIVLFGYFFFSFHWLFFELVVVHSFLPSSISGFNSFITLPDLYLGTLLNCAVPALLVWTGGALSKTLFHYLSMH